MNEKDDLPTFKYLCIEMPLYESIALSDREFMRNIRIGQFQFDAHCVDCDKEATFRAVRNNDDYNKAQILDFQSPNWMFDDDAISVNMFCSRNNEHIYLFNFLYNGGNITKYGQIPSIADIISHDLKKYSKLLPKKYFSELMKATGLISHGVGIGSFVYLRRIFERLIVDHYTAKAEEIGEIEDFQTMRMEEKIMALRQDLPPALVENRAMYGILSKGIHELDEETCKNHFPIVQRAIIAILEQDLQKRQAEQSSKQLRDAIAKVAGEVNSPRKP